ncbi:hypothetical protein KO493_03710 [Tamlana agarivorans]|uniref:Uncharacterized protein n=1 Tax=Pseudotamlana agarivorans TaxID=481183 RepID=A0ACC5U655_9FLAO|nr:hypothetical protein [Tamlana agarivorans]MBU2949802.1 hypothetical protein [Tamlana agarivorans]
MKAFIGVFTCFLFCVFQVSSQEVVLDFEFAQKSKMLTKEVFSISNQVTKDWALFIKEKKAIQAYLFDTNFKQKVHFSFDSEKRKKYNEAVGTKISGDQYSLVFSTANRNKFCVFTVDFATKTQLVREFKVDLPKEAPIKTINYQNKIYFLSSNSDDELIIRELTDNDELKLIKRHALDLQKGQQINDLDKFGLDDWASKGENFITEIANTVPNSIELASERTKVYREDDQLFFTFDSRKSEATGMLVINLTDFSIQEKAFAYPKGKVSNFKRKNSYYVDGTLFQIASSNLEMCLTIKSMNDSVLQTFRYHKNHPIAIRNSIITQEGLTAVPWVTTRTFDETSKFLRKISSANVGVSAYKIGGLFHLTVGGSKEISQSMPMMVGGVGSVGGVGGVGGVPMVVGTLGSVAITLNPVGASYTAYSSSKSTYFRTSLDANYEHVAEASGNNIFEKIKAYGKLKKYCTNEDVFYHNENLLYGYLNMKEGHYKLVKF